MPRPVATEPSQRRALAALGVVGFRRFWLGALVSNTGGWMQNATVPYVVFTLTGSAANVGVAGFFQYVPFMLMGLVGGSLADRYSRRGLLIATQVAQAACAVGLYALVAAGAATTTSISAVAFVSGLAAGVNTPIWQAFVTELVPRELLMDAVTLNSAQFNASRALGPFLAGVVIATLGPGAAFLINAGSFLVVIGVLVVVRGDRDRRRAAVSTGVVRGVTDAARHAASSPAIVACCVAIVAVAGIGSPLFSYLPVYGEEVFRVEGVRLGLLFGAGGIGSVLFTPVLLTVAGRLRRSTVLSASMVLYGSALIGVGLSPAYGWVVAALLVYGGAYLAIASTINTTIQLVVDEAFRGTVIAIYLMCLTGALPVGLMVWGVVSDAVGIRVVTVGAGCTLVAVTAAFVLAGRFRVMSDADAARDAAALAPRQSS
jgi:MFS family permease